MLVHGQSVCGHGKAEDIQPHLLASWTKILLSEVSGLEPEDFVWELGNRGSVLTGVFQGCPTMHRLAAVSGLVALVGSEDDIIHVRSCLIG